MQANDPMYAGYGDEVEDVQPNLKAERPDSLPTRKNEKHRDFLDSLFTNVNYDLLLSKVFYFFFFGAFGCLFPLMAVYFKQLGMNASQAGFLIGVRPFIEFFSAPLWGGIADKWQKGKKLLLFSLFSWVAFMMGLGFVTTPASACLLSNGSKIMLVDPWSDRISKESSRIKREIQYVGDSKQYYLPYPYPRGYLGQSPLPLEKNEIVNSKNFDLSELVSPPFSSVVYRTRDIQRVFLLIIILVIIGEFFSSPAATLADSAVLGYLGDDLENYGRQRLFGSFGWALAMFFVAIALDHSHIFPDHPCGSQQIGERNYTVCFAVFSVLMACAFLAATQLRFIYEGEPQEPIPLTIIRNKLFGRNDPIPQTQTASIDPEKDEGEVSAPTSSTFIPRGKPGQSGTLKNWLTVLREWGETAYAAMLFQAWFMGFGVGLVFAFLFWHLQDLGGAPSLFGVASVINHVSEVVAYFFSKKILFSIGHVKVLYLGLFGNACRFLYVSWLSSPWWVLPFEFVQGLTHALVWASACSYLTQGIETKNRSTAQGILQLIHHGLGRGSGAIIGGALVQYFGTEYTFRGYGIACIVVLLGYIFINWYFGGRPRQMEDIPGAEKPDEVMEETSHLAPCGVPMNPMSRNLSSSRLSDLANQDKNNQQGRYGTTSDSNGYAGGRDELPRYPEGYGPDTGYGYALSPTGNNNIRPIKEGNEKCKDATTLLITGQPTVLTKAYLQQPEPLFGRDSEEENEWN